jgi:hypothetical protein
VLPISEETIKKAKAVNLVAYLLSIGEPMTKEGRNYRLKKHDSLTINADNSLWKWNSQDVGGKNAIDYLMTVENQTFTSAVTALVGNTSIITNRPPPHKKADFILPTPAENNRRVFAYLHKERKINPEIINHFIKGKTLYEEAEHHNAVFVGTDEKALPRFACKRSTVTIIPKEKADGQKRNNRWDVEGSKKQYGFRHIGSSDRIFVFEAPIDMLSFITIRSILQEKDEWKNDSYLSLAGVSDCALSWLLSQDVGQKITRIVYCLDNDEAGQKNAQILFDEYKGQYRVFIKPPKRGKDYNDYLKILKLKGDKTNG